MPPQQVRRALGQLASALEHLRGFGLVHADLKPANILTKSTPRPLVADAGAPALDQSGCWDAVLSDLAGIYPALF